MSGEGRYLDDYARELAEDGERAFRRRHAAPVLIVSGKSTRKRQRGTAIKTATDRPTLHGLLNRVFPLVKSSEAEGGPVVIGRADGHGVDVAIPDPSISKRHCAFTANGAAVVVGDYGSTNGTAVNGARVGDQPARLAGGETITLGRLQLTFETAAGFLELVAKLGPR